MTNLDSILKNRDITLLIKVHIVKAMDFLVIMYGCESQIIKKTEHRRIDAFELWCWRRLLRVPWSARRLNQSFLKEISPGCSLEGLMLKLKLQYFGHLRQRANSLEKILMLGKIEGRRKRGWQRMRWLDGITDSKDMSLSIRDMVKDREACKLQFIGLQRVRHNWATKQQFSQISTLFSAYTKPWAPFFSSMHFHREVMSRNTYHPQKPHLSLTPVSALHQIHHNGTPRSSRFN